MQYLNRMKKAKQPVTKQPYRVWNWKDYHKALVNRGSLTTWFDQPDINLWLNQQNRCGRSTG